MKFRFILFLLVFPALVLLVACSTARLASSWKEPGYSGKPASMLVIGVSDNQARRVVFESTIAEKLKARGVKAIPSYSVFREQKLDKQIVADYARKENLASVIVTKVLDSQSYNQRVSYVNGSPSMRNPYYRSYNGWYDDYRFSQASVVTYDTQYVLSNLETNLYQLEGEAMVWSALVEVESNNYDDTAIQDLTNTLIKQMVADGLI